MELMNTIRGMCNAIAEKTGKHTWARLKLETDSDQLYLSFYIGNNGINLEIDEIELLNPEKIVNRVLVYPM